MDSDLFFRCPSRRGELLFFFNSINPIWNLADAGSDVAPLYLCI